MTPTARPTLEERVVRAATNALADHEYASAVDVLAGIGFLSPVHVEDWRKGRLPCLEQAIQARPEKVLHALKSFHAWAQGQDLHVIEAAYLAPSRSPNKELRFSASGDPEIEKLYRIHYLAPEIPAKKKERISERLGKPADLVVFDNLRDSECSECKKELPRGSFLFMEAGRPLCMACADLDHLVFLPSGDAALTRRAKKYSGLHTVVVRFSRARNRYERQGLLVEEAALARAEEECLSDADLRARRRVEDALRRAEEDQELAERMAAAITSIFPGCPPSEARAIASHTAARGSGRVGRSTAGRALEEEALRAAVIASIRHKHTNYDELLMRGVDRTAAREDVRDQIDEVLHAWERASEA